MLCCDVLCFAVLCCVMLCCVIEYCGALGYFVLCFGLTLNVGLWCGLVWRAVCWCLVCVVCWVLGGMWCVCVVGWYDGCGLVW